MYKKGKKFQKNRQKKRKKGKKGTPGIIIIKLLLNNSLYFIKMTRYFRNTVSLFLKKKRHNFWNRTILF